MKYGLMLTLTGILISQNVFAICENEAAAAGSYGSGNADFNTLLKNGSIYGTSLQQEYDSSSSALNSSIALQHYSPQEQAYLKCKVNAMKDKLNNKVANTENSITGNISTSNSESLKQKSTREPNVNKCASIERGMGMGETDSMTAFLVNKCSFKIAVNFCYTGQGVTSGNCSKDIGLEWAPPHGRSTISGYWGKGIIKSHVYACKDPATPHTTGSSKGLKGYCSR